jgi:hypothetical protein
MTMVVALDTLHRNSHAVPPRYRAVKYWMTGSPLIMGLGARISTTTAAVTLPASFVAINVYTVLTVGYTILELTRATGPTPLSMETVLAPETLQLKIEEPPSVMLCGAAVNDSITGFATLGITVIILFTSVDHRFLSSITLK